jgi:hypothetical protein
VLPNLHAIDKTSLIIQIIDYFPVISRYLSKRKHNRPPFEIKNEYDVQDLLFVNIRAIFEDARMEEWTPKHGGKSKRIDIVVPSCNTVIEAKYIRDENHAKSISDELKVDIESYHAHSRCQNLLFLVYDSNKHIIDPSEISNDLSGRRVKGKSNFDVQVLIR